MRTTATAVALQLLLLAGCTASPAVPSREPSTPTEVLRGGAVLMDDSPERADAVVPFTVDEVWGVLRQAYEVLGIEVSHMDPRVPELGNRRLEIRRTLGESRGSEYFDCGRTATGMPAADAFRIRANVTTQVFPADDGGTLLITSVGATGRALQGTSSGEVRCASTGRLEQRIRAMVILALEGATK